MRRSVFFSTWFLLISAPGLDAVARPLPAPWPEKARAADPDDSVVWLAKARAGDSAAMIVVARRYRAGGDLPQDWAQAERWYRAADAAGNATGALELAEMWLGFRRDPERTGEAVILLEHAADRGNARAMYDLGRLSRAGIAGRPPDRVAAHHWFERAAAAGYPSALAVLGDEYLHGSAAVPADPASGLSLLRQAAALGSGPALDDLGKASLAGVGGAADAVKATVFFMRAADTGYPRALVDLGDAYRDGRGVPADPVMAVAEYRQARRKNVPEASLALGGMYLMGQGVAKDETTAVRLFSEAAREGLPQAYLALGNVYAKGAGAVTANSPLALACYGFAAEKGDAEAIALLADNVSPDDPRALTLLRQAAREGSERAKRDMAAMNRQR